MSNAVYSEPSAPGSAGLSSVLENQHAIAAPVVQRRRISADSFRQLTARLKLKSDAFAALAAVAEVPAEKPAVADANVPEPVISAPPEPELAEPAEPEVFDPAPEPAYQTDQWPELTASLPAFEPLGIYVPVQESVTVDDLHAAPEPEFSAASDSTPVDDLPPQVELPPMLAFEPSEISAVEALTDAESWEPVASADEAVTQPDDGSEVPPAEAWPVFDTEDGTADLLIGIFADEPETVAAELPLELEAVAEDPQVEVLPDLEENLADDPATGTQGVETLPEVLEVPVADVPEQSLPADDIPAHAGTIEAAADGSDPAPKTPASEIAGRVFDAMLKTISTAIYAKPSAAERAAFLRQIAELTGEEANRVDPPRLDAIIPAANPPEPVPELARPETPVEPEPIAEILANRIGPAAALLKVKQEAPDPFAQNITHSRSADPRPVETVDADEGSGELALTLLDMMSGGTGSALPHERTLASDTLLRILPRIPVKQLLAVVERVAIMETPPPLLVAKLIRDSRHEVVAPLLERCSNISEQDLMNAAPDGDAPKLRMIARRRSLSTVLSDYLIATGEPGVVLTLIRNPGAALSHAAFFRLAEFSAVHHGLLAPLATRADLPPPVAFELFWHVPQELRRFIFSRFLTDSETLNKILRITLATYSGDGGEPSNEVKFPPREKIDAAVAQAAAFRLDDASQQFSEMGSISKDTALRILSDREGEPFAVLMKALGYPRTKFEETLALLRHADSGILRADRSPEELQAIFDGLSFNKARILLTYWDWYVRKSGPYAPHN